RRELTKKTAKMGEECKVAIRNIRRDANDAAKKMQKSSEITEDDLKQAEKTIQEVTDKYIKEVDVVVAKKDKEIMEI
ncbi:MAG: ribosome recycling factor, partial [Clostridia bacterium]|nr:ribosome recycling factor [Clostridia bacterium]